MPRTRKKAADDPVVESTRAKPWIDRQLPELGPLLFWRDAPDEGREGIACITTFCPDPECPCRDAALDVFAVDDHLLAVEVTRSGTVQMPSIPGGGAESKPTPRASCMVDLDSGSTTPDGGRQDEAVVAWLKEALDQDVLDLLRRRWIKMKPGLVGRSTPVRAAPTPGRNDPCPCGSGRKYKQCCIDRPPTVAAEAADPCLAVHPRGDAPAGQPTRSGTPRSKAAVAAGTQPVRRPRVGRTVRP